MSHESLGPAPARGPEIRRVLELAARWYVFYFLNLYGFAKILGGQFYTPDRLPAEVAATPLGQVTDFDLAWTFMGRSFAYMLFIALGEILGAWLLLWERTKLLGVAVLLPILLNILAFDVIFFAEDEYGALASATIYTLLLFLILHLNKERVVQSLRALTPRDSSLLSPRGRRWKVVLLALAAMAILFAFDQLLVNLLGHGRG